MIPQALLTLMLSLPVAAEDAGVPEEVKRAQLTDVAVAIHEAAATEKRWPGSRRELELMLATTGWHESKFAIRIGAGEFKPWESDPDRKGVARAHSFWQLHLAATSSEEAWRAARTDVRVAAREAARTLTRARYTCKGTVGDWVTETLRAYAGSGCRKPFKGEAERVATFKRLEKRR